MRWRGRFDMIFPKPIFPPLSKPRLRKSKGRWWAFGWDAAAPGDTPKEAYDKLVDEFRNTYPARWDWRKM
jgi:hypothetical protein